MDTNQFPTTLKLMCRNFYIGPIFHTTPYWHTFLGHHFPLIANGPRKKRQSLVLSITANLFDVTRPVVDIVFLYVASCVLFWCCECFCHCHVPFHFVVVIVPRFSAWPCDFSHVLPNWPRFFSFLFCFSSLFPGHQAFWCHRLGGVRTTHSWATLWLSWREVY